jgi:hypothetical protein
MLLLHLFAVQTKHVHLVTVQTEQKLLHFSTFLKYTSGPLLLLLLMSWMESFSSYQFGRVLRGKNVKVWRLTSFFPTEKQMLIRLEKIKENFYFPYKFDNQINS